MRVEETLAIAALIQATAVKLYRLHANNQSWRQYSRALLMENKWRAARYGISGSLIDFGQEREVDERALILEYLDWVDDVLDELGSREEVESHPLDPGPRHRRRPAVGAWEASGRDLRRSWTS